MSERLRTITEQAEHLQVPVATLYRWHSMGTGPCAVRIGRHLRYRPEDTNEWLDELSRGRKTAVGA